MLTSVHRLYQREGAGRPPRVRWALEEAGAPYEYVVLTKEEGRSDEHAARHPLWAFFAMTELEPTVLRVYIETHADKPDPDAVSKAEERLARAAAALAGALDGHDYLVDDRFRIADVVMGGVLHSARRLELMPDSPVLHAYLSRLDEREAKQLAYAA